MTEEAMRFRPLKGHHVVLTYVRTSNPTTLVPMEELEGFVRDLGGTVGYDLDSRQEEGSYVVVNGAEQPGETITDLEGEVMVLLLTDWLDGVYAGIQDDPVAGPALETFITDTADFGGDDMRGSDLRRVMVLREFANSLHTLTHGGKA